jgi:hypothetical protein
MVDFVARVSTGMFRKRLPPDDECLHSRCQIECVQMPDETPECLQLSDAIDRVAHRLKSVQESNFADAASMRPTLQLNS